MNRLDELITELCPNGVEYKTLGEMCTLVTKQTGFDYSNHIKPQLLNEKKEGSIPYIQTKFFSGHSFDYETDYFVPEKVVAKFPKITLDERCLLFSIVGASIGNVGLFPAEQKCFLGGAICVAKIKPEYNVDYLYYCAESRDFQKQIARKTKGAQATITVDDVRNFKVPVPPLEVQQEIVRVLDHFTLLSEELSKELSTELRARRKQYEYYRELMLTFENNVPYTTLDKISDNCDSRRKPVTKGNRTSGGYPYYGASGVVDYVNEYLFDGDYLLVSEDGANLLARVTPIAFSITGKNWVNNHAHVLKFDNYYVQRFVEIYLNSIDLSKYISGAAQPKLNQKNLNLIPIPFPDMNTIERTVSVLNAFENIYSDISISLPAEIETRQKQYEYYRDKLLAFKEIQN